MLSVPVTYAGLAQGRHRRLPRQLDADAWRPTSRRYRDDGTVEVLRANLEGAKYTLAVSTQPGRRGAEGLRRHRQVRRPARQHDLRHRAGQRRQPADPRHDREGRLRPRRRSSWRRAPSRRCWPQAERAEQQRRGHRLPRLGAAPDERQPRDDLPDRRRRRSSGRTSAARRSTPTSARAMSTECPNVGKLLQNLEFTLRHGERDHGRDPRRRRGSGRRRGGVAEGEPRGARRLARRRHHPRRRRRRWPAVRAALGALSRRRGGAARDGLAHRAKIPVGDWAGDGVDWLTAQRRLVLRRAGRRRSTR